MRILLVAVSIVLLFSGIFGSAINDTPVEIKTSPSLKDKRTISFVRGQNLITIKDIDSVSAFSNKDLVLSIINK